MTAETKPAARHRMDALDLMRGLVMVLMAVDHSSEQFNKGRLFTDSAFMFHPRDPLPPSQFLLRWVTHLCAPTFVFLAGTSMAINVAQRTARGESAAAIDRYLLVRGVLIAGFELWVSFFWMEPGHVLFQVLYAIGSSFLLMIPLRRLPTCVLVGFSAVILLLGERIVGFAGWAWAAPVPVSASLLLVPHGYARLFVAYPTLPWLAQMLLGWAFGKFLLTAPPRARVQRSLVAGGIVSLLVFALVRGENGYGNMHLLRDGASLVQWLHVSKYPPGLSYVTLELGVAWLILAALYAIPDGVVRPTNVLVALGRTPMFFYLLHIPLLVGIGHVSGLSHTGGIGLAILFAIVAVAILYWPCVVYRRYKAAHPDSVARFI